jgi:hypothetical protein
MIEKLDALLIRVWNYHPLALPLCMVIFTFSSLALIKSISNVWVALFEICGVILMGIVVVRVVLLIERDKLE